MFQNIGMTEWVIIGGAVLLIFGPKRLPEIGRGIGRAITEFKSGLAGATKEIQDSVSEAKNASQDIKKQINSNSTVNSSVEEVETKS